MERRVFSAVRAIDLPRLHKNTSCNFTTMESPEAAANGHHLSDDAGTEAQSLAAGSASGSDPSETTVTLQTSEGRLENSHPENDGIAKQENQNVFRLRLLVITVLLLSTIGVAVGVFLYVSRSEQQSFEQSFRDDSDKILDSVGIALDLSLGSVDAFLVSLVSYARDTNASWPFVTYPDYAVKVAKLRSLSKAVQVTQYHIVSGEQREEWEAYSVAHDGWVENGIKTQISDESYEGRIVTDYWTSDNIFIVADPNADPYTAEGPFLPKWQQSPVIPVVPPYNWDAMILPSLTQALPIAQRAEITITSTYNIRDPNDPYDRTDLNNDFIKDYVSDAEDYTEPFSDIIFPILDYAADYVTIPKNANPDELGNFVGVLTMTFYWRDLIKDILPADSVGIIVVFENNCGETFTYQINGPKTLYLGEGDLHEKKYDQYLSTSSSLKGLNAARQNRTYTGLSLSDEGCTYTIHLYPSTAMEENNTTSDPITFTLVAVAIFAFTSTVFVCYDYHGTIRRCSYPNGGSIRILTFFSYQIIVVDIIVVALFHS